MGTSLELRVKADSLEAAKRAEDRVLREIDRLSAIFSGYDPKSEFRRWQKTPRRPVPVSPELFEVLRASDRWRDATGGAFDPRVAALDPLWASCAKRDRPPNDRRDRRGEILIRPTRLAARPAIATAEQLSDCPLTLDAIAKGYIVGRASEAGLDPAEAFAASCSTSAATCGSAARATAVGVADPSHDSESTRADGPV